MFLFSDQPYFQGWTKQQFDEYNNDDSKLVNILECANETCNTEFAFERDVLRREQIDFEFPQFVLMLTTVFCRNILQEDNGDILCAGCFAHIGRQIEREIAIDEEAISSVQRTLMYRCKDKKFECIHAM